MPVTPRLGTYTPGFNHPACNESLHRDMLMVVVMLTMVVVVMLVVLVVMVVMVPGISLTDACHTHYKGKQQAQDELWKIRRSQSGNVFRQFPIDVSNHSFNPFRW